MDGQGVQGFEIIKPEKDSLQMINRELRHEKIHMKVGHSSQITTVEQ